MTAPAPDPHSPLALVGMACLFPKADGLGGYWATIRDGVDGITDVPASHWKPEDYFDADPKKPDFTYAKRGGFLSPVDFNPVEYGITPNNVEATDASQLLGLVVANAALKDAGYGPERAWDKRRASVILGVTGTLQLVVPLGARLGHPIWRRALAEAGIEGALADQIVADIADGYVGWQENSFPGLLGNVVAGRIANRLDFGGTNCVVDAACASSLSAAHLAALELASGRADMVVTGGVDTFNDIFMYMCFSKTPALSPSGDARPFDAHGDGTILGEGLGMVVLKRLADAERDGDRIYAVLKGIGTSSDGRGKAIYAPSADGQKKALGAAYELAGVSPETIELVEAHGTGTKVGDAEEVQALTEVYRAAKPEGTWVALGSVKSQIGHTKAAAGAAGLIKAALALHHKVLPPTIKVSEPTPVLANDSPFYLNTRARPWLARAAHPRRAAVSAFGFGGSNFHAVLEEYVPAKAETDWNTDVELVALSGASDAELEAALAAFAPERDWNAIRVAAADSRAAFDAAAACRLLFVLEREATDRAALLANVRAQLGATRPDAAGRAAWTTPDGAFYGAGAPAGSLAMIFPGQGAQYVGMGRDWACQFPEVLEALAEADRAFGTGAEAAFGERLSDRLYPAPAFDAAAKEAQEAALRDTRAAQPGIGAVSYGAYRVLSRFGLTPAAVAGHSYGELVALCVAGRYSPEALFALSCLRGRLMAEGEGDRGAMLAVVAPIEQVAALVSEHGLDVVLANKNTPTQAVLSGATAAIDHAEGVLKGAGLKVVRLPVSAAFHSPLVADAAAPLREALADVAFAPAACTVYANKTAAAYPEAEDAARDLLASQLAAPVEFVAEVTAMADAGVRTFLEVGPGARLTGMVKAILADRADVRAIALDASNGRRSGIVELARALAAVGAAGHAIELEPWNGGREAVAPLRAAKKPGMTMALSGVNYRAPRKPSEKNRLKVPSAAPAASNGAAKPQAAAAANAAAPSLNGVAHGSLSVPAAHNGASNGVSHGAASRPTPPAVNGSLNGHAAAPAARPQQPAPVAGSQGAEPNGLVLDALRATQESLAALQKLQEQTAQLHRRFLEGQETAQHAFSTLIAQQQTAYARALLNGGANPALPAAPSAPVRAVPPVVASAPARALPSAVPAAPARPLAAPAAVAAVMARPAASVAVAPAPKPAAPTPAKADVFGPLLGVVAEKTGYPAEMLNLDMELEADLGIDSIKRVEILSALQERLPEAPVLKPEHLGTLRTLRQIGEFLGAGLPAAAAPAPAAPAPSAPGAAERVEGALLAVVAEKTGYPAEMLNFDMELEADLGIDSIKRVEILSALQERLPEAPVLKPEHLGTLRTLRQIIGFLSEGMPSAVAAPVSTPVSAPTGVASDRVEGALLAVVAEKTGYPSEMLNLDMELEADLGIDSIKRVEILSALQERLPEAPVLKPEHLGTLRTLRQIIGFLSEGMPSASAAPVAASVASAPAVSSDRVEGALLAVVAEKTGYPAEMLNLDMELEADLGIDSIKRVEILSALQERLPEAPVLKPEHLGTLRTLRQIIAFLATESAAPAPVSAPAASVAIATGGGVSAERAQAVLLAVIAEKTGYPAEMLSLDMELEADLGIDSIKRVEIVSTLQEQLPDAPEVKSEHLGSLRSLRQMSEFLATAPQAASAAVEASAPVAPAVATVPSGPAPSGVPVSALVRQVVRPVALPREATEGAELAPGAEIALLDAGSSLGKAVANRLFAMGYRVRTLTPGERWENGAALDGAIVLAPSAENGADGLWSRASEAFLRDAFFFVQSAGPALRAAAAGRLMTVSRLDGAFGFAGVAADQDVASGGLAGLAKTAGHEWTEVACKAVDVAAAWTDEEAIAQALVGELLQAGPREVGLTAEARVGLSLVDARIGVAPLGELPLAPGDVVVVSGGARGVTAEVACALAEACQPTLVLLGRTPLPEAEPAWLAALHEEAAIKQTLLAHAEAPLAPKALAERYAQVMANREVRATLARIEAAGAAVHYRSVDVRDAEAVAGLMAALRTELGAIRGVIHGAGVLADRLIEDKTPEQFDAVFGTKVEGLRALLAATNADELRTLVLFSSVTGREGRTGQVDYAIANEVLNKVAASQAVRRPACRVVAVNWGPWDGGMVTPALKKLFAAEGVGVVPLDAGAAYLVHELAQGAGAPAEVLVLGPTEAPEGPQGGEPAPNAVSSAAAPVGAPAGESLQPAPKLRAAFTRELSLADYPCLASHVLGGHAVLPAALMIEWLTLGALHANPGLVVHGFEHFRVLKGVRLGAEAKVGVRVFASGVQRREDGVMAVAVELRGTDAAESLHAQATVRLGFKPLAAAQPAPAPALAPYEGPALYNAVLFHGPAFQAIEQVEGLSEEGLVAKLSAAPAPAEWMSAPLREAWLTEPLLLDAAFQLMIVWSTARLGAPCLPCHATAYRQYVDAFPAEGVSARMRVVSHRANTLVANFQFLDAAGAVVAELVGAESTVDAQLSAAFERNHLPTKSLA